MSNSIAEVTRFLGVPASDVEAPRGQGVYSWYNGWQRDRNHYEPMAPHTKALLNRVFCEPNQDLAALLRTLSSQQPARAAAAGGAGGGVLLPSHGYACVT